MDNANRLRELEDEYRELRGQLRAKKAELDEFRVATGHICTFEPPSEVTEADIAAAAEWAAQLAAIAALPEAERQAFEEAFGG